MALAHCCLREQQAALYPREGSSAQVCIRTFESAAIRGRNLTGLLREGLERPTRSATPGAQATDQLRQGSLPRRDWSVQPCQPQIGPRHAPLPHRKRTRMQATDQLEGAPLVGGIGASNPFTGSAARSTARAPLAGRDWSVQPEHGMAGGEASAPVLIGHAVLFVVCRCYIWLEVKF